jgi:hypothetical protein
VKWLPFRILAGLALLVLLIAGSFRILQAGAYGWTIFVVFPMLLGAIAAWTASPSSGERAAFIGASGTAAGAAFLLVVGVEGLLCIVMVLPLACPMGALGGWLVFRARSSSRRQEGLALTLLVLPCSITWDLRAPSPIYEVRTAIEVAAAPEQVWKHVVAFSEIPGPHEWFFRAGLAYPQRARIVGSGVGAVRYCEFSTGAFVEPIEEWQEPRLLRFRVSDSPPPMREMSPYKKVAPRHLHGYLVSKRGEFRLTQLPNHHTLLEGTTSYQHGLWPAEYWRWWSDAIIHRIHLRVLSHIRDLAEREVSSRSASARRGR